MIFHINAMVKLSILIDLCFTLRSNLRSISMQSDHRFHPLPCGGSLCTYMGREQRIWADLDESCFGFKLEIVPLRFNLSYAQIGIKR